MLAPRMDAKFTGKSSTWGPRSQGVGLNRGSLSAQKPPERSSCRAQSPSSDWELH